MKTLTRSSTPLLFGALALVLIIWSTLVLAGCYRAHGTDTENPAGPGPHVQATNLVDAGRYIVRIGGCNDCHTAGFMEVDGNLPESEWLTGLPIGFQGPWGTSYPSNLRLLVQDLTEEAWVQMVHTRKALPPMPWPSLNHMSEQDARAVYQFIKSLGPKGERVPTALPPGQEPATPYFVFVPQHMERMPAMPAAQTGTSGN